MRRAVASDAPILTRMMHESSAYQGPYAAILEGYEVTDVQIARDAIYVAEACSTIVGFYSLVDGVVGPELDLMFVLDEARGLGIGRQIFAHVIATARSRGWRSVTIISHPPAEAFYLRMGASRVGIAQPTGRVRWKRPILALAVPDSA
ncbi:GNAT family N-acetyltransferase [Pseudactinotalea sp.]|uniref:GNAT family N-acetyltransferase n=1 Tax=Pseudactinotalea sp. TaxID=1926260 RepID=UPI003B3B92E0